ncbi:ankyrin repeat-containing domain protein [Gorgonomyces haynaldii]|nr:ankyrin repeat-containing domain protein [Gorgonomyces haynaldii]
MQCRDRRISDTCKEKILERILDLDFHYIKMLSLNFLLQSWRFVSDRIELSSKHCISTDEKWTIADQAGLRCHTIIKILMEENRIDFGKFKDKIAHVASRYNDLLLLKKMVDLGADMSSGNDYALRLAAEHGHEEIVAYLLQNQSVQPNTWNNFPIRIACSKGHHKVVELLLRHPKVDSQAFGHQPLYSAAEKGHNEVVQLLLSTPSDDHTNVLLGALKIASANGHLSIVELLMQHCNNISKDDLNFSLKMAAMNGFTDVVLYFIGSHGKDLNLGEALQAASQRGRIDVVALLLPKCSTEDIQKAITCARIGRKTMVLEYLLACVT